MRLLRERDLDASTYEVLACGDDAATHDAAGSCDYDLGPLAYTRRLMRVVDEAGAPVLDDDARPMKVAESATSLKAEARQRTRLDVERKKEEVDAAKEVVVVITPAPLGGL